jgi:hypothetical protein
MFDNAVDVIKEMHPTYHFVFLFDQSSGHAEQRLDGLSAAKMNNVY